MNRQLFIIFLLFFIFSCQKKENAAINKGAIAISPRLHYLENKETLEIQSGKFREEINQKELPFKRIVVLNASLVGYIAALGLEEQIVGVSSPEYIYSQKIHQLVKNGKIADVGNEQKYDLEKIIALKPDVIFTNYIEVFDNSYDILRKNNIRIIFLNEYLEEDPLHKTAYLKIFGKLLGAEKKANKMFRDIEDRYHHLEKLAVSDRVQPEVIANEIYGSQWFMPGGRTQTAEFIRDANARYILKDDEKNSAIPMSFEEVFVRAKNATYWINAGNHSTKNEMLNANPNYAKMEIWKNGRIYTLNGKVKGKSNDYFESGVVRSDLVLKDYVKIFHPKLFRSDSLVYMKELH